MSAHENLQLHPNRPLRLDTARHAELRVDSGTVWITASGMAGDLFVSAGEGYRLPREGLVLAEAVRGIARVRLVGCAQPSSVAPGEWWRGLLSRAIAH